MAPVPEPFSLLSPQELTRIRLRQAADAYRAHIEWRAAFGLGRTHQDDDHRHAEALCKARAQAAFNKIKHGLEPTEEAHARLILERSPRAQQDPEEALMMARLVRCLDPKRSQVGIAAIQLRIILAKIAQGHPGVACLLRIWLDRADREIHANILNWVTIKGEAGEAELERAFDVPSHANGIPTEDWWAYPARLARRIRLHPHATQPKENA